MRISDLDIGDEVILDSFVSSEYVGIYSENYGIVIGDKFTISEVDGIPGMKCIINKKGAMVIPGAAIFRKL